MSPTLTRFRPGVQSHVFPGEGVILTDGALGQTFVDPYLPPLLPFLHEGQHTDEQIASLTQAQQSPANTFLTLERLRHGGWLENQPLSGPLSLQSLYGSIAERSPQKTSVSLKILGEVPCQWLDGWAARLQGHPWLLPVESEGNIEIVVCPDYRRAELRKYAAEHPGPWLPLRLQGQEIWLGPLQTEPTTLGALLDRLDINQTLGGWLTRRVPRESAYAAGASTCSPCSVALGLQWALLEVEKAVVAPHFLRQHLLIFDLLHSRVTAHPLPPVLDLPRQIGQEIKLEPVAKPFPECYRLHDWRELWPPLRQILDDRLGTALLLEEVEATRVALPLYYAHSLFPPQMNSLPMHTVLQTQAGRAQRPAAAAFGALAETVERHSGLLQAHDRRIQASFEELGDSAISPHECLLLSPRQYAEEQRFLPLDPAARIYWSPVWSLSRGCLRHLPTALLYYPDDRVLDDPGTRFVLADTNGCCAGSCLEEAVLHALLELVERDAVAVWWYNRLSRPALDLQAFGPEVAALAHQFAAGGEQVWALDLTHDLGIPVVAAVSVRREGPQEPALGFGCHIDPASAVLGALQEAVQCSAIYQRRTRQRDGEWVTHRLSRTDNPTGQAGEAAAWIANHSTRTDPYLLPSQELSGGLQRPWAPAPTFLGDIDEIRARLEERGLEVLLLDQSRPEFPLKVARAIVPGLRMFWRRLAPGRLYQVPVQMGWLPQALTEEQLNPVSLFF